MNSLSFVGDMTKGYGPPEKYTTSSNLGHLIVSIIPNSNLATAPLGEIYCTLFAGVTDESRYGFNTLAMPVYLPNTDEDGERQLTPYNSSLGGPLIPASPNRNPIDSAPAAYYTRIS
jgi:hypothetical protein